MVAFKKYRLYGLALLLFFLGFFVLCFRMQPSQLSPRIPPPEPPPIYLTALEAIESDYGRMLGISNMRIAEIVPSALYPEKALYKVYITMDAITEPYVAPVKEIMAIYVVETLETGYVATPAITGSFGQGLTIKIPWDGGQRAFTNEYPLM